MATRRARGLRPRPHSRKVAGYRSGRPGLSNRPACPYSARMVTREEILVLGLTAGVTGGLVGGLLLGIGLGLVVNGAHIGWLLLLPAGPAAGGLGWLLARRLAKRLPR